MATSSLYRAESLDDESGDSSFDEESVEEYSEEEEEGEEESDENGTTGEHHVQALVTLTNGLPLLRRGRELW